MREGRLHGVTVERERRSDLFILRCECAASAPSAEVYACEVRCNAPPQHFLAARSCSCVHYRTSVSKTGVGCEGQQRICKHLCALLLTVLESAPTITHVSSVPPSPGPGTRQLAALSEASSASTSHAAPPPKPAATAKPPSSAGLPTAFRPATAAAPAAKKASCRQLPSFEPEALMAAKKRKATEPPPGADESSVGVATHGVSASATSTSSAGADGSCANASERRGHPRAAATAEHLRRIAAQTLQSTGYGAFDSRRPVVSPAARQPSGPHRPVAQPAKPSHQRSTYPPIVPSATAANPEGPPFARPRGAAPKGPNGQPKRWNPTSAHWDVVEPAPPLSRPGPAPLRVAQSAPSPAAAAAALSMLPPAAPSAESPAPAPAQLPGPVPGSGPGPVAPNAAEQPMAASAGEPAPVPALKKKESFVSKALDEWDLL